MATFEEIFREAQEHVGQVEPPEAAEYREAQRDATIIDVREKVEWDLGHVPGARHIPRGYLELRIEESVSDRSTPVLLYCASGVRSLLAARTLQSMGYENVHSIAGGFNAWKEAELPFIIPRTLNADQLRRYSRHIVMPEIGEEGQFKLLHAKVLVVGAGGLGSSSLLYLAAAGLGTLGVIDSDVVDESNLQRQVLHATDRIGMPKTTSAQQTLNALNPEVRVVEHQLRLTIDNVDDIIADYDVILDGSDNFATRYTVNEACVRLGKPNVSASILSFEGQVTTFLPGQGPCYRCIYPEPPPASMAPT